MSARRAVRSAQIRRVVVILVVVLTRAVAGQCPGFGDCCVANGSAACNDTACCVEVCTNDPFCCSVQWDQNCATLATNLCAVCGAGCPGTGNCCSDNGTPACDNPFCCNLVCTGNPFCCDISWDALCAQQAGVLCALCSPPPDCPGGGDCCAPNGSPSCDDAACCVIVCAVDEFCCVSLWDNICAATALKLCSVCAPVCDDPVLDVLGTVISPESAMAGDQLVVTYEVANTSVCAIPLRLVCFMAPIGGGPALASPECEQDVTSQAGTVDTFARCFNVPSPVLPDLYNVTYQITDPDTGAVLDEFSAFDLVILSQGDLTGDGEVGVLDFLLLLGDWGPCAICAGCPADFDLDCQIGINDMLTLLANWGPV